jgi:hypothetical protein
MIRSESVIINFKGVTPLVKAESLRVKLLSWSGVGIESRVKSGVRRGSLIGL